MKKSAVGRLGMTALEVLVATMLASLMLASVAGLLGILSRQDRELRAKGSDSPWKLQLAEQLQWDLLNARRVAVTRQGVWLDGYGARDFATAQPNGLPATIQYGLVEAGGRRWLVRREIHPTQRTTGNSRVEFVCADCLQLKWNEMSIEEVNGLNAAPPANELFQPPVGLVRCKIVSGESQYSFDRVVSIL